MRQKGFATIFGLCMILAIALCVKSIQEDEMNHARETTNFQTELELQSAADGGIYEAAEIVRLDKSKLPANPWAINPDQRKEYQKKLIDRNVNYSGKNRRLKNFKLEVWGERLKGDRQAFQSYQKKYPTGKTAKGSRKSGYILFSVASTSNATVTGKIYRRAFAYVLDDDETTIHFMDVPSDYS